MRHYGQNRNKADECGYCDGKPRHAYPQFDGYGIYCGRMCDVCFRRKFRPDIMERYDADEPIEPEPEVGGW